MSSTDLMCSICLEVFSDPVSTPCGHNFCKICLNTYWSNTQDCRCPNCKETFKQRPDLKINTTLRDVVDEHKKKSQETQPKAEVVCDICTEGKLKAVKSCLVCQSSYCETHLESHLRVSGLQKHKLIDPVKNLQDYICQKHDRPLELFCRDDHTCVCLFCTEGDHKNHNTVPIRESELQEMMEERQTGSKTQDEYVIKYLEQEITEMKKRNIKLLMIADKQRAAETQDKSLIKDLKKEITEIQLRNNEMEMVKQKQITAENVIKDQDQEITDLKKRNTELEMIDDELKKRDDELEMRDAELEMMKKNQITAENVIKVQDQEITDLKKKNIELKKRDNELKKRDDELKKINNELVMVNQKQITAENVINVRDQEITDLNKREDELKEREFELKKIDDELKKRDDELKKINTELVMVNQKQITAENVIKVRDQEITDLKKREDELKEREFELKKIDDELKKRDDELKKRDDELKKRDDELKKRDDELKKRDDDLKKIDDELKTRDDELKKRDDELKKREIELKKINNELKKVKQKQITAENVVKVRDQQITDMKANYGLVENIIKGQDQKITELKKRNIELKNADAELKKMKQKQITAENVIKDRDQEITELKKRNTEQQQKISNTEDDLLLLQGKQQEYSSRLQKSSSENLCSRIVGIVLLVLFIIASARLELLQKEFTEVQMRNGDLETEMLRCKAGRIEFTELQKRHGELETEMLRCKSVLKWMQQYAVDVTLDPDTAHPKLILSDDKKQVRSENIDHHVPNNPKRFDSVPVVLGKEGFSSGRFYYEVQVKGKSSWSLGVVRESVDRKGFITRTPVNGLWTVWLWNDNKYLALTDPPVSLSLSVKPQKVGVFVDYEEGLVSFYDVENRSHIYSFTDQSFTEKLYPYFSPCVNNVGKNLEPLIITPVIK